MGTINSLKSTSISVSGATGINFNNNDYIKFNDTSNVFSFSADDAVDKATVEAGTFQSDKIDSKAV